MCFLGYVYIDNDTSILDMSSTLYKEINKMNEQSEKERNMSYYREVNCGIQPYLLYKEQHTRISKYNT